MGTAGPTSGSVKTNERAHRFLRMAEEEGSDDNEAEPSRRTRRNSTGGLASGGIDQYFGFRKGTGMRLSYAGAGYPLTLIM